MTQLGKWPPFRLRLLQPEQHVHLAVHGHRGGEVLTGLLPFARSQVEAAEAEVAVGLAGASPTPAQA